MSKDFIKRFIVFAIGIFFTSLGIAYIKYAGLGISPISSVANVFSLKFTAVSFGMWTFITNMFLFVAEILVLRKKFKLGILFQLPLCFFGGTLTDIGILIAKLIPIQGYLSQMLLTVLGVLTLGFGISVSVKANLLLYPGEGFVKAVADTLDKKFSTLKVYFDVTCVSLSILFSILLFNGQVVGLREGTLISGVFTGFSVKLWNFLLFKNKKAS